MEPITLRPIGVVRLPFTRLEGMSLQSVAAEEAVGRIELRADLASGLKNLDGFSHLHIARFSIAALRAVSR